MNFAKTLFARMGNVKSGKFIDDETGESLSDVESVLTKLGIKLRDNKENFRNFGNVLDEVGGKWNGYSSVQQHAIATAFAGTRQQEKFLVLMSRYKDALSFEDIANKSSGSAKSKYDSAYMSGIQASLAKAQAQWEQLSQTIMNSDLIKGGIDFGSGVLGFLTNTLKLLKDTHATIPLLIASFATLKGKTLVDFSKKTTTLMGASTSSYEIGLGSIFGGGKQFEQAKSSLLEYTKAVDKGMQKQEAFDTYMQNSSKSAQKMANSYKAGSGGLVAFGNSLSLIGIKAGVASVFVGLFNMALNAGIIWLATTAIQGLIKHFDNLTVTLEEQHEITQQSISDYQEAKGKLEDINTQLSDTQSRISELNNKPSLTFVEQAELDKLKEVNKELQLSQAIAEANAKNESAKASDNIKKEYEKWQSNWIETPYDASSNYSGMQADVRKSKLGSKEWTSDDNQSALDITQKLYRELEDKKKNNIELTKEEQENEKKYYDFLNGKLGELQGFKQKLTDAGVDQNNAFYQDVQTRLTYLFSTLDPSKVKEIKFAEIFDEMSNDSKTKLSEMASSGKVSLSQIQGNFKTTYDELVASGKFSTDEIVTQFNAMANGVANSSGQASESVKSFSDILKELSENDAVSSLSSAYSSLIEKEELSLSQVQKLIEIYPDLVNYLDIEKGTLNLTTSILEQKFNIEKQNAEMSLRSKKKELELELSLAEAYNITNLLRNVAPEDRGAVAVANSGKLAKAVESAKSLKSQLTTVNKEITYIDKLSLKKLNNSSSSSKKTSTSTSKSSKDDFNKELADLKHEREMNLITDKQYYDALEKLNIRYYKNSEEHLSEYYQYTEEVYKGRLTLLNNAKTAIENLSDKVIELIKKEKENEKQALSDSLDNIKRLADARKNALDKRKEEDDHAVESQKKNSDIAKLQNDLMIAKLDKSDASKKKQLEIQEELNDKKKELTEFQNEYSIEKQKEAIDKEVENAQTLYDQKIKIIDNYLNNQEKLLTDAMLRINGFSRTLYNQLINYNVSYGDGVQSTVVKAWQDAYNALKTYGNAVNTIGTVKAITTSITANSTSVAKVSTTPLQKFATGGIVNGNSYSGDNVLVRTNSGEGIFNNADMGKLYSLFNYINKTPNLVADLQNKAMRNYSSVSNGGLNINMGDVVVQGNATQETVDMFKKAKKELINDVFNKINSSQINRGTKFPVGNY